MSDRSFKYEGAQDIPPGMSISEYRDQVCAHRRRSGRTFLRRARRTAVFRIFCDDCDTDLGAAASPTGYHPQARL